MENVDRKGKQITITSSNGTLTVTDKTRIIKDGRRAALSDVKEGDEVRASYSESGDTKVKKLEVVVDAPSFTDNG